MLALNAKALDLLHLLRGEIFSYLHFWIQCWQVLAGMQQRVESLDHAVGHVAFQDESSSALQ